MAAKIRFHARFSVRKRYTGLKIVYITTVLSSDPAIVRKEYNIAAPSIIRMISTILLRCL
jgi:hypothetical protein